MTRTLFLVHSVSKLLNKQVHFWPLRDLGQEMPLGARLELRMPPESHCRERCVAALRSNPFARLQPYPGHHLNSKTNVRSGTPAGTGR
jgi:hypothetical protein